MTNTCHYNIHSRNVKCMHFKSIPILWNSKSIALLCVNQDLRCHSPFLLCYFWRLDTLMQYLRRNHARQHPMTMPKKQIVYNSFKVLILLEAICRAICSKPSFKYYMSFDIFSHNFENTHSIFTIQHKSFCPNFERSFGDCFALTFKDMIFSAILHSCTCMY